MAWLPQAVFKPVQLNSTQLNKTHPTIVTSLKNMESQLGFPLFDRSGYRLRLTKEGKAVYRTVKRVIKEVAELKIQATHLREGEETELNIKIVLVPYKRMETLLKLNEIDFAIFFRSSSNS